MKGTIEPYFWGKLLFTKKSELISHLKLVLVNCSNGCGPTAQHCGYNITSKDDGEQSALSGNSQPSTTLNESTQQSVRSPVECLLSEATSEDLHSEAGVAASKQSETLDSEAVLTLPSTFKPSSNQDNILRDFSRNEL
jgi:hypothetical protein